MNKSKQQIRNDIIIKCKNLLNNSSSDICDHQNIKHLTNVGDNKNYSNKKNLDDSLNIDISYNFANSLSDQLYSLIEQLFATKFIDKVQQRSTVNIAVYNAITWEIKLNLFILKIFNDTYYNKLIKFYYPVAYKTNKTLKFIEYLPEHLTNPPPIFYCDSINNNIFKLQKIISCYNLDLMITPLIATDSSGVRLGRGGGYYDTTINNLLQTQKPILCGVGYDCQFLSTLIPADSWDISLDFFVSNTKIIKFNNTLT